MSAPVDGKAKAEVLVQLCKVIMELSLVEMADGEAALLEAPMGESSTSIYEQWRSLCTAYHEAYRNYVEARRELHRWGKLI